MKNFITIAIFIFTVSLQAQESKNLLDHYSKYYKQMQSQGDIQGVINALTHLNIIDPNENRKDTLAVLYMNEGRFIQALNTIGVESLDSDSDMAVEVKAISLQSLNEIERALPHYEELFKRKPNPYIAYELADIKIQLNDFLGALKHITFGIANSNDDIYRNYFDTQTQYQVPMRAAFIYLKGLLTFKENKEENIDKAITLMDEAIELAPNFNLAKISIDALNAQKTAE
tara:strand:+ start:123 stop:809 length:687 start_codon:yes stop_codon:yes gene_type:complete